MPIIDEKDGTSVDPSPAASNRRRPEQWTFSDAGKYLDAILVDGVGNIGCENDSSENMYQRAVVEYGGPPTTAQVDQHRFTGSEGVL